MRWGDYVKGIITEMKLLVNMTSQMNSGKVYKSTLNEDMRQHVDVWWDDDEWHKGIDVKGYHKDKRKDKNFSPIHWIEAKNIYGNDGWIYGKSEYIAFEMGDEFIFVPTAKLREIYESRVMGKEVSTKHPDECYIPYQREYYNKYYNKVVRNKDVIFKMPDTDLLEISSLSFYKDKKYEDEINNIFNKCSNKKEDLSTVTKNELNDFINEINIMIDNINCNKN